MDKKELLNKGLIPKYITTEQAENIEMSKAHAHNAIKQLVECKTVKSKMLDTGECVIDTLDLLDIFRTSDKWFAKEQKQKRLKYLKQLMKECKAE